MNVNRRGFLKASVALGGAFSLEFSFPLAAISIAMATVDPMIKALFIAVSPLDWCVMFMTAYFPST